MFDHVTIRVSDRAASRVFYEAGLSVLGREVSSRGEEYDEWNDFSISQALDERPLTRGLHVAFVARSRDEVDAFWRTLTDAGYDDDGAPGLRLVYHADYYGAFVRDPDGNSVEAVYHGCAREGDEAIDHLWIRVADLGATRRFYAVLAPVVGVRIRGERRERFHIAAGDRSSAFVHDGGPVTENVHVAFPAADDATVQEFHRAAVAAGYRDNGPPGERPEYHPGYYSAYIFDPDGNNVEVVNHNRGGS